MGNTDSPWHPDSDGLLSEGNGGIGGDSQVGAAYSVRFRRDDKPGSLITVTTWASGLPTSGGLEYGWDGQVEYLTCTDPEDPGCTETWARIDGLEGSVLASPDIPSAECAARAEAERWLANIGDYINWDGEPFHN